MNEVKRGRGHPPIYTPELADLICLRIAQGVSLNAICKEPDMPSAPTVYSWLFKEKDFINKYAHARESQSEVYAQEMIELADTCALTPEQINKVKLQIDTRKWIASKLKPKKYGDSTILRGDKDNPIEIGLANLLDAAAVKRQQIQAPIDIEGECIEIPNPVIKNDVSDLI